jgi:amino acid adenylation domain-containing protein
MHHIVSDGWSMGVLIRELSALYRAFSEGQDDPLPELGIQYADYAAWQRRWVTGDVLEAQTEYWRKTLAGAPELLTLPTDRPRPSQRDLAGGFKKLELDESLTQGLKDLSQRHETTLFMTLLSAWATLLGRLAGQDEVVIGTPVANRTRAEVEPLIGFFVNALALRVDMSGSPSLAEILQRVKAQTLAAQEHQDLPFEQVVEIVSPPRSLTHDPVFQVMFGWEVNEAVEIGLPGLTLAPVGAGAGAAKHDLSLYLSGEDDRIVGGMGYATALFDGGTIERYCGYLRNVLEAMVGDDQQAWRRAPLLSQSERNQLLVEWNATRADYPHDLCVHELFEAQAARAPHAIAVAHEDSQLSYGALNARANRLAHALRNLGVEPGARVAVLLERSIELALAELAILKCGAAYLPLDQDAPVERQAFMIEDSRASLMLSVEELEASESVEAPRVNIDALRLEEQATQNVAIPVGSEMPAYVIYTSGSTGQPKGVVVPHRAIGRLALNNGYAAFEAGDRVAFTSNPAFDASTMEVWAPLLHGGCVVVIPRAVLLEPNSLEALLRRQEVDILHLVAGLLGAYAEPLAPIFPRLRYLLTGGDVVDPRAVAKILRNSPPQRLIHCYGPSESTTFATTHEVSEVAEGAKSIPIGRPIGNTRTYLLDSHGQPAPIGAPGEIYVGGAGVAHGYLNRPELTAERFVADPFANESSTRMYKTGDLGRYLADGTIEFLGRNDFQVKIRGYRIELGEIEARLSRHPAIRDAVVLAREDSRGEKHLVAYYTVATEQGASLSGTAESTGVAAPRLSAEVLRGYLSATLPEYMAPAAYVELEALPLTPNGKLDRRALPAPDMRGAEESDGYLAPRTQIEEIVVGIFEEVLKLDRVGRRENFFELGGHSLLATQVISRVRKVLGVEIGVRSIFERATAEGLSQSIEEAMRAGEKAPAPPLVRIDRGQRDAQKVVRMPLSFAQQRLWFLDQLAPNSPLYNCPGAVRLGGRVDLDIWERVINEVVRRHEALRTRIEVKEGEPVQVIDTWEPRKLERTDLTSLPPEKREEEARRIAREEAETGFDLSRGPMLRVKVLKLEEEEHLVLYTMHHIVSDEWSMGILIREVETLYRAYSMEGAGSAGEESPLPELEIQYADFAVWQRAYLAGGVLENEIGYWREQLKDAAVLELPADRARPAEPSYRGGCKMVRLGHPPLSEELKTLSRREGTTLFMALMAGFKALLMRYSGQEDISVGTAIANRTRREVEGLIGFFVNTLVMRTDLSGNPSFRELVKREREVALGAYAHQEAPFEKLVEELNPERDLSRSPLFQVMMVLQNAGGETSNLKGVGPDCVRSEVETMDEARAVQFDLTLTITDLGRELAGTLEYSRDLFEAETIERLINHYTNLLNEIARDSERPISELNLLSDQERGQVILGWNQAANPYPEDRCIHHLFEQQVERTPEAVAVVSDEGCLSYGELNRRASQLARYLRGLGIGPEAVVGVCLERSVEMLVGLLGALKAGGAYLPLDPTYPAERLSFMLEDAAARLIVTQEKLGSLFSATTAGLICLNSSRGEIVRESGENIDSGVNTENLAYVIYTSGSTGVPKGTMVTHRSVVNLVTDAVKKFRLGPESRFLQFASLSFDVVVEEIYPSWSVGGSVVLLSDGAPYSYSELTETIEKHEVTTVELPTVYWREWMRELSKDHGRAPRCLDLVITGDERISAEIFREWKEHKIPLLHVYGVTEATVNSIVYPVPADFGEGGSPQSIPIGKPIANTEVYLLDGRLQPTPLRIPGEVCLGGVGVSRGYLNRPELTAERFVPSPFGNRDGSRLYRSGDLARSSESGWVEFIGRADAQVKLRGYRIELGEIESELSRHPAIGEAVALAREDNHGDKRLVAYYTVAGSNGAGSKVEAETLRVYLSSKLPGHMIPTAYVELESLPLTPNGKLNRRALPQPDGASAAHKYEAPVGEVETTLARIWAEALKLDRVGRHDNFFALGGHSLLALSLIERMRSEGLQTDVRTLFITPTIAKLAAGMEKMRKIVL